MKYLLTIIVAVILGFLSMRCTARWQRTAWETRYLSEVVMPTERAISDINGNLKDGKLTLVRKKLELLDLRYQQFRQGGATPEFFLGELYKLNEESQQPRGHIFQEVQ